MRVLLVDDSKVMRQIQRRSLEGFGFTDIVEAGDGVEGLQQMAGTPKPDIVILDWNMPRLDGLSTLRKIRETDKKTIVIMCTTEAEKPRVVEAVSADELIRQTRVKEIEATTPDGWATLTTEQKTALLLEYFEKAILRIA